jgi:YesN/AraC family two-component response regulator
MANCICLIVDDEPMIRGYLRAILDREDIEVIEADNAAQALGIVKDNAGRLDFILTDIRMPGELDGVDLANSIRHMFPSITIVLMSGYRQAEFGKRLTGEFQFIQKPFMRETILNIVRQVTPPAGS